MNDLDLQDRAKEAWATPLLETLDVSETMNGPGPGGVDGGFIFLSAS